MDVDHQALGVPHTGQVVHDGGAYVLENLDLRDIAAGPWDLVAPPLRLEGLDAAPVRAVLRARAR